MVTPKELEKYWKQLSPQYMTEESDDPDDSNTIVEHKLSWRSKSELSLFMCLFSQGHDCKKNKTN